MDKNLQEKMRQVISPQRLVQVLAAVLFYFLGNGVIQYLGLTLDWRTVFLGLGFVVLILISCFFFQVYFDPLSIKYRNTPLDLEGVQWRKLLYAGLITLTISSVPVYLLIDNKSTSITLVFFLALMFLMLLADSIPPIFFEARGYGELILTVWTAVLVPALAFPLQGYSIHSLVPMLTLPLSTLFLAMLISTSLQKYLSDFLSNRKTLVILFGWKFAMNLHNGMIFAAIAFIAAASLFGLPWNLAWPMLLPAPIFFFSVYEIFRIKSGIKPRWALLALCGYSGIGCMLYVLLFTLWVR
jgi:1,4-dihydroxy-2-naphthoate octaprenyltransferase